MIQRIQSVLLAIASMLSVAEVFLPAWKYSYNGETEIISGMAVSSQIDAHVRHYNFWDDYGQHSHLVWFCLSLVVSLYLLAVIFFFKNRLLQIRLCQFGIILIVAQIAALMYLSLNGPYMALDIALGGMKAASTPQFGFALPVASLILTWIASKRIMADEKLVRSVDRLRD